MKFFWSLSLLAAAASAQSVTDSDAASPSASGGCDAEYIVKRCLETENAKVEACEPNDWDCFCAAYEAVATCFNNCPDDTRAGSAKGQVQINCQNASLYGTATKAKATKTASATTTADATATESDAADETSTATDSAAVAQNTNNAAEKARNTAGVLLAVAGVVAAIL
ncbi:hypothetical protein HG530_006334 [Fusarium avenaceum]|nr:hypothetical protein DER45DRAFT_547274 [Fusarium avenaceum]KAI6768325.1 hypothetical protein HG530_006334 [Fusarium avenaceum]KIL96208.1 hypothetical protein FAVG1_00950 [Fusarium avenaceum]